MKKGFKYIGIVGIAVFLQSCFAAKDYTREQSVVNEKNYRTDQISTDSLSMAAVSWKEIFTDAKLGQHIDKALSNNLDIRMALQNIEASQAYVKQGKAAYFPTITGNIVDTYASPSLNSSQGMGLNERPWINQFEISGSLSWEADIWGKLRSNERAFTASYLQTVAAHQAVKSNLVAQVASTYYQLLALDEQKRITEQT